MTEEQLAAFKQFVRMEIEYAIATYDCQQHPEYDCSASDERRARNEAETALDKAFLRKP